jgi:ABC-2 type transport system permease protein
MLGVALAQLPPALVIAGPAVAAFGLAPRACAAVDWVALGLVAAVSLFGRSLELSHWVLDLSPFSHAPRLPGVTVAAAPLAALSALAVSLARVGLATLGRRDL